MTERHNWLSENQKYLTGALRRVREGLLRHAGEEVGGVDREEAGEGRFALDALCRVFRLSSFERDLLLLCAGVELDSEFASVCAQVQNDPARPYPTFSLALGALPDAHWSAITPTAPLRRWRLIEMGSGDNLTQSRLRIDERILHYLTGVAGFDEQLLGFVEPLGQPVELAPSQRAVAERIASLWSHVSPGGRPQSVQLTGPEGSAKQAVAGAVCAGLGLGLYRMRAQVIPTAPHEMDILLRLWEREAALNASALLLDCEMADQADTARQSSLAHFIDSVESPLIVVAPQPRRNQNRPLLTFGVEKPTAAEQHALWEASLRPSGLSVDGHTGRLAAQFNLDVPAIQAASFQALGESAAGTAPAELADRLWRACRTQARPRLDDLARRIEPLAVWDDLVLPERERQALKAAAIHVRHRMQVYEEWGFASKSSRGLGISALFSGPSGTGKTMAAEVLANELQLDLYHIDLSQVVSKYIGETEKNLRRVFDAAEEGGAILFFDEADALFGKRSEVKDSHDRYANIEVSYLLQRMEAYRGLAILTTNMKKALDPAFLRRIRFIVQFPFPDALARAEIWRRVFPAATPTERLDVRKLARLNVSGGNIRNIALNAAFLAADAGEPVRMTHLLEAARTEYGKLEKSLTGVEIEGWL